MVGIDQKLLILIGIKIKEWWLDQQKKTIASMFGKWWKVCTFRKSANDIMLNLQFVNKVYKLRMKSNKIAFGNDL